MIIRLIGYCKIGLRLENLYNNSNKQLENKTDTKIKDFTSLIKSVKNTLVTSV